MNSSTDLDALEKYTRQNGEHEQLGGRQEHLENIINSYILT